MNKITVAEYAKLNNISVQAVYKKINKLNTVEETSINGRKQIFIIIDNNIKPYSTDNFNAEDSTSTTIKEDYSTDNFNAEDSTSTTIKEDYSTDNFNVAIQILKEQLQEKDKQIEKLYNTIEIKDKQIQEQFDKLTNLLLRAQELEAIQHKLLTTQEPKQLSFWERIFKRKREE